MTTSEYPDRCVVCGRPDGYRRSSLLPLRRWDGYGVLNVHGTHRLSTISKAGYWLNIVTPTPTEVAKAMESAWFPE